MKPGERTNMWFVWVYLFFCAKKIGSSGGNAQTGVASGETAGQCCMDKRSNGEGGWVQVLRPVSWAPGSAQGLH